MKRAALFVFIGVVVGTLLILAAGVRSVSVAQSSTETPSYGKMDFETFRMISSGMTETEVLSRAGRPFHKEFLGCGYTAPVPWCPVGCVFCQTRWDYLGDGYSQDWIFEMKFLDGRVFETNNYRRTP